MPVLIVGPAPADITVQTPLVQTVTVSVPAATAVTVGGLAQGTTVQVETTAGPQGPAGPQGGAGPQGPVGIATVVHGADPTVARPAFTVVFWYGSVEPNNWTSTDLWVEE